MALKSVGRTKSLNFASVIVPTFNRRKTVVRTIEALLNQTWPKDCFEIVIVDDCSIDDTVAYLELIASGQRNVRILRHVKNEGRVATRNSGIEVANGEIIVFLDDDNIPDERFVEAHMACHNSNVDEHIAVMGNVCFASEISEVSNFAKYMDSRYLGRRRLRGRFDSDVDYHNLPARCLGTLNCSMRREDLLAVGMFDPDLRFYGFEDSYLGHCLMKIGVRILFGPDARSVHWDSVSLARYALKYEECTREGLKVVHKKDATFVEATRLRLLMPPNWRHDSFRTLISKLALRCGLNSVSISLLQSWASATDSYKWCYCPIIYRLLLTGWHLRGIRSASCGKGTVTYSAE